MLSPPPLRRLCRYWGISDSEISTGWRAFLIVCAVLMPAWTFTSWWLMKNRVRHATRWLLLYGVVLEACYAAVLSLAIANVSRSPAIGWIVIISTALQICETCAYLSVMGCLNDSDAEMYAQQHAGRSGESGDGMGLGSDSSADQRSV